MRAYIDRIADGARLRGYRGPLLMAQCDGGLLPADAARELPVGTLQSGPVGGIAGAAKASPAVDDPDVIVADMGGTTFDVGAFSGGVLRRRNESIIERHLTHLRKVDIESVGAGGGSIAWLDRESGVLRVGPHSAGADPGPICYGRGGTEVTVTDADLVLGVLNPERPLAGGLRLDVDAARKAIAALGEQVGLDTLRCAAGIVEIVDRRMEDLLRRVTIQAGRDPRRFSLWAYGGASAAHVGLFARGLGVRRVLIPLGETASVWSACGCALLDQQRRYETSTFLKTPFDLRSWSGRPSTMPVCSASGRASSSWSAPAISSTRCRCSRWRRRCRTTRSTRIGRSGSSPRSSAPMPTASGPAPATRRPA